MNRFFKVSSIAIALSALIGCTQMKTSTYDASVISQNPIILYSSNELLTMSDKTPIGANSVVVQEGKIVDLGKKETLIAKYQSHPSFTIDEQFEDKVITPGFVEPHIHLWLSAILLGSEFITPADWNFPWGNVEGIQGNDAYFARLTEIESEMKDKETPLLTWGYHNYFHGSEMSKEKLNAISNTRPIIVWHRSFHELYFNDAAMEMFGWSEASWTGEGQGYAQLDWDKGHAYENGAKVILNDVLEFMVESGLFATGMERTRDYVQAGGITTAIDPGVVVTPEMYDQMIDILMEDTLALDYWLIPAGNFTYAMGGYDAEKGKVIAETQTQTYSENEQIRWLPKYVKLFTDGAMYSQLMHLKEGYIDGHEGEWLQTPQELEDSMRPYWKDGYTVVIHANGDVGFETAVDIVETLNSEVPRSDHRTGFHHLGITDKDDIPRAVEAGANFSVNPYYTHILAELYGEQGVGKERAEVMSRGRSFIDAGGMLSLHSDAPMAPAQPLSLVWAAVNRIGLSGETVQGPQERITVDEAMKAITINAAYTARLEETVGSIEIGKFADFAVLDESPYSVKPERIDDINITATVYRGVPKMIDSGKIGMQLTAKSQAVMNYLNQHEGHSHDHDICETSLLFQQIMIGK